jgi:hypothetical protein
MPVRGDWLVVDAVCANRSQPYRSLLAGRKQGVFADFSVCRPAKGAISPQFPGEIAKTRGFASREKKTPQQGVSSMEQGLSAIKRGTAVRLNLPRSRRSAFFKCFGV